MWGKKFLPKKQNINVIIYELRKTKAKLNDISLVFLVKDFVHWQENKVVHFFVVEDACK